MESLSPVRRPKLIQLPFPGYEGELLYTKQFSDLFWQAVEKTSKCWLWCGSLAGEYGVFAGILAHRYSFQLSFGSQPVDNHIHHICFNKICVNPDHLQSLTPHQHGLVHGRTMNSWVGRNPFPRYKSVKYSLPRKRPVTDKLSPPEMHKGLGIRVVRVKIPLDVNVARHIRALAKSEKRSIGLQALRLIDEAIAVRRGEFLRDMDVGELVKNYLTSGLYEPTKER